MEHVTRLHELLTNAGIDLRRLLPAVPVDEDGKVENVSVRFGDEAVFTIYPGPSRQTIMEGTFTYGHKELAEVELIRSAIREANAAAPDTGEETHHAE